MGEFAEENSSILIATRKAKTWTEGCHSGLSRTPEPFFLPWNCLDRHTETTAEEVCKAVEQTVGDPLSSRAKESMVTQLEHGIDAKQAHTTVQLRNIPASFTRDRFLQV